MSFIGEEGRPAPKLKDAIEHMTKAQVQSAYNQVVDMMVSFFPVGMALKPIIIRLSNIRWIRTGSQLY